MNRKAILLFAAVTVAATPSAMGQAYTCTVLYPLTPPPLHNFRLRSRRCVPAYATIAIRCQSAIRTG